MSLPNAPTNSKSSVHLSIVTVSWNVWPLLKASLRSIEEQSHPHPDDPELRYFDGDKTLEVVIVDSASSDETVKQLPKTFPWVRLLASETNLGFTAGNNQGYAISKGEFIYFLNPDTAQVDDSFSGLYTVIANDSTIGIVGPKLRYGDGTWQSSRRRFPTLLTGFLESTWLGQLWPTNPWAKHFLMDDSPTEQLDAQQDVDWLVGAAIMGRRTALETVRTTDAILYDGPFDEQFFMYSEELDLGQRVKSAGWRVVYVPDALVIHYEGRSSEQVITARHIRFNTSKVRYYKKYFGPVWASILRHYLLFEFRLQGWIEGVKWLLGHKRELRAARIASYREVIASGLRPIER
ncbi:MAG: glycosyltransferase family 2 protein [Chloroflexota bacterium]